MLDRHASTERLDELEQRALLRRTRERALAMNERRKISAKYRHAALAARRFRRDV
jgi:hypothetical protein